MSPGVNLDNKTIFINGKKRQKKENNSNTHIQNHREEHMFLSIHHPNNVVVCVQPTWLWLCVFKCEFLASANVTSILFIQCCVFSLHSGSLLVDIVGVLLAFIINSIPDDFVPFCHQVLNLCIGTKTGSKPGKFINNRFTIPSSLFLSFASLSFDNVICWKCVANPQNTF